MKVTTEGGAFKPFSITLTIESEREAQELFTMFNHGRIVSGAKSLPHEEIREQIKRAMGGDIDYHDAQAAMCKSMETA